MDLDLVSVVVDLVHLVEVAQMRTTLEAADLELDCPVQMVDSA